MNALPSNSNQSCRIFAFGEFSFDTEKRILWHAAGIVSLAPKACELLGVLIENAPQVLSREELMNRVWNDSFVEEANLTHHISALRKALGEDKNGLKIYRNDSAQRVSFRRPAYRNETQRNGSRHQRTSQQ